MSTNIFFLPVDQSSFSNHEQANPGSYLENCSNIVHFGQIHTVVPERKKIIIISRSTIPNEIHTRRTARYPEDGRG